MKDRVGSPPVGEFGDGATRLLGAVLAGHRFYGELVAATGLSRQPIHAHLHRLRDAGLVRFEDGKVGTLRPVVAPVAFRTAQ